MELIQSLGTAALGSNGKKAQRPQAEQLPEVPGNLRGMTVLVEDTKASITTHNMIQKDTTHRH